MEVIKLTQSKNGKRNFLEMSSSIIILINYCCFHSYQSQIWLNFQLDSDVAWTEMLSIKEASGSHRNHNIRSMIMKVNIKILIQSRMYTCSDIKQIIHGRYTFRLIELYCSYEFLRKTRQEEINRLQQNNQNCLTFVSWGQNDEPSVERSAQATENYRERNSSKSTQSNCGYSLHVGAMHMLTVYK